MKASKQQDAVSARAPLSGGLRRVEADSKAKGRRVFVPYIKVFKNSGPPGKREWMLSWRPVRAADLRHIWNGPKSLDKKRAARGAHHVDS